MVGVHLFEEREEALRELRAWYKDWSETARAVIGRRDHLILMGLAHRKRSARKGSVEEAANGDSEEGAQDTPTVTVAG